MTEHMFRMQLDAFVAAIEKDDDKAARLPAMAIAGQVLLDIHRIADALEKIAAKG